MKGTRASQKTDNKYTPWGMIRGVLRRKEGRRAGQSRAVADVTKRLRRAEGQIRGVIAMLEAGRDCAEIVTQSAAVSARWTGPGSRSSPAACSSAWSTTTWRSARPTWHRWRSCFCRWHRRGGTRMRETTIAPRRRSP